MRTIRNCTNKWTRFYFKPVSTISRNAISSFILSSTYLRNILRGKGLKSCILHRKFLERYIPRVPKPHLTKTNHIISITHLKINKMTEWFTSPFLCIVRFDVPCFLLCWIIARQLRKDVLKWLSLYLPCLVHAIVLQRMYEVGVLLSRYRNPL